MRRLGPIAVALVAIAVATLLFHAAAHQLSSVLIGATLRAEVRDALQQSMDDQKRLRNLDPQHAADYKRRFDEAHRLAARMDVLRISRASLLRRYELLLSGSFAVLLLLAAIVVAARQRRNERRLAAIQKGLEALSCGEPHVALGDTRGDAIGRVARMIEATANVVARQRRRIESLQHLSSWQEAARRHAHEIRTPVTAARLEVERLASLAARPSASEEIEEAKASALEELDRLARYTTEFSSFAKLPQPVRRRTPIDDVIAEFCSAFSTAWPNLALLHSSGQGGDVLVDRDLLRQVLVNLCSNSSAALNGSAGKVTFRSHRDNERVAVDVSDDGCGVDGSVAARLFEPYATTKKAGEGMGLGLAICRKIMLDHDGDLELVESSSAGTTFRLLFPAAEGGR